MGNQLQIRTNSIDLWKQPEVLLNNLKASPLSISGIFKENTGHLKVVAKTIGENQVKISINRAIIDLLKFFNSTETLSLAQVSEITNLIFEDYAGFLTLDDLVLCFKNVKKKQYKKEDHNWARIQGTDIMDWVRTYDLEKTATISEIRIKEKRDLAFKSNTNLPLTEKQKEEWAKTMENVNKLAANPVKDAMERLKRAKDDFLRLLIEQQSKDEKIEQNGQRINFNQYLITYE